MRRTREVYALLGACSVMLLGAAPADRRERLKGPPALAYLAFSFALLAVWLIVLAARPGLRREMALVSLGTIPLGLTEPLFVPRYWNPPTLWDLAQRTGFDLESLVFCFAVGGIVFSAYYAIFRAARVQSIAGERGHGRHRYHLLAVLSAPALFVALLFVKSLNPIYASAIALVGGFLATLYCRPDLWLKMVVSGLLFLFVYFVALVAFDLAVPRYVVEVWNLRAISGLLVVGVPLEELMFAFTFGLYWSSVYEHFTWRRVRSLQVADATAPS